MVCFFAVWLALILVGLFFCILGGVGSLSGALAVLFLLATGFIALTVAVVRQILKQMGEQEHQLHEQARQGPAGPKAGAAASKPVPADGEAGGTVGAVEEGELRSRDETETEGFALRGEFLGPIPGGPVCRPDKRGGGDLPPHPSDLRPAPLPLLAFGHFPLIGGIVLPPRGKACGRVTAPPLRRIWKRSLLFRRGRTLAGPSRKFCHSRAHPHPSRFARRLPPGRGKALQKGQIPVPSVSLRSG